MAAHRQSPYVALSRALLTAGAALALARVLAGGSWIVPVLIAAALPAALLTFAERRHWNPLIAVGVALVVGTWLTMFVDDPSETFAGFPTASALATFGHDLGRSPHVLRSAVVPVPAVGAALMLSVLATFVAALATELIARRLDAPIGAIGPSIALFVVISALGSGRWAPTTALYALVVVEYLVALHHFEMESRRTWFQSRRTRRSHLFAGGAAAGAIAVAAAIALGPGVPGAHGGAWIKYRSLGSGAGSSILNVTSPLVSVRAKLTGTDSSVEVFSVRTTEPKGDYWRVIALDQFQDDGWGLNSDQRSASKLPGPTNAPGTKLVTETFHLGPIDAHWLPAAYRPVHIDAPGSEVLPGSTSLFLDKPISGLTYHVRSEISNPDPATLEAVTDADLQAMSAETALPRDFSARARQYAQEVTKDAPTPYQKGLALMTALRSAPFVYDQTVDLGTSANALDKFLFQTRRGFCEQFASAFAELARSVGLPTRVAVGYQPGTLGSDGLWHVQEKDAHAWPEVWLGPKIGWYRFEPTPGRTDPITGLGGPVSGSGGSGPTTTTSAPAQSNTPTTVALAPVAPGSHFPQQTPNSSTTPSRTRAHVITVAAVALAALIVAFIALVAALAIGAWQRTRRRRHDPDVRRRVLGAWTEALERLSAAGIRRRPATTSLEFALRQAPALGAGAAGPPLMSLARLHTSAMYSPDPPSTADADEAWSEVDAIAAALRGSVPLTTRLRARWSAMLPRPRRARGDEGGVSPEP